MKIINYSADRAKEITDLFYSSVHAIDCSIYSQEQKQAWASFPIDYDKWSARLSCKKPFLLLMNNQVVGFIELASDGHIDCAYVSPKFQRTGVGTNLLKHILYIADQLAIEQLYVEASIIARPLFEKFGFSVQHENKVIRNNVVLVNYTMNKLL